MVSPSFRLFQRMVCADVIRVAKVSPDSFIQQALQLAWYRDQGYASATYETAGTRGFLHGRTETIRVVTAESRDFVKSMVDDKANVRYVESHDNTYVVLT
jgi:carnitine O-acetyltransferase